VYGFVMVLFFPGMAVNLYPRYHLVWQRVSNTNVLTMKKLVRLSKNKVTVITRLYAWTTNVQQRLNLP